jgi:hypothetical protein
VIFSVYDYDRGRYRYFEGLAGTPATGFFRKARRAPIKGAFVPEAFAVQLPPDARPVGEGTTPKGYVAEDPRGLAAAPVPGEVVNPGGSSGRVPWWAVVGVAVVAFFAGRAAAARRGAP